MRWIGTVLRRAKDALGAWYRRLTRPPCPDCGSLRHRHLRWQCAACFEAEEDAQVEDSGLPRCGRCGCKHLDSVRECRCCGRVWNPRLTSMAEATYE